MHQFLKRIFAEGFFRGHILSTFQLHIYYEYMQLMLKMCVEILQVLLLPSFALP